MPVTEVLIPVKEGEDLHKETTTNSVFRFFANTLPGRIIESGVSSTINTTKVTCLSPWGDGNPIILPTIRKRDVVLLGVDLATGGVTGIASAAHVFSPATDYFLSSTIAGSLISHVANEVVSGKLLEDPAGKYLDRKDIQLLNLETEKMIKLLISVKHKLYNENAVLGFWSAPSAPVTKLSGLMERAKNAYQDVKNYLDNSPGWYSPYLMSTHRLPAIPRSENPTIIMCYAPFIPGDYLLAHQLVASIPNLVPFCNPDPDVSLKHQRMLITLTGIRPFRNNLWTSSRRPDEGKIKYLLADGIPAIIIPVRDGTPLINWSAFTLHDGFHEGEQKWLARSAQILAFIEEVIDWKETSHQNESESREILEAGVKAIMEGAWKLKGLPQAKENLNADHAGIVLLRYGNRDLFKKEDKDKGWNLFNWRKNGGTGKDVPVKET